MYDAFRHGLVERLLKLLPCSFDLWLALPEGINTIPAFVVFFVGKELIGEDFGIIETLGEVHIEGAREVESAQESNVASEEQTLNLTVIYDYPVVIFYTG